MKRQQQATPINEYFFLEQRVAALEREVFKKKKGGVPATKAQKLLLLKDTGILDLIDNLISGRNRKASFISILLDENEANIRKDLSNINLSDSIDNNISNLEYVLSVYTAHEVKGLAVKTQDRIASLKSKPKHKVIK